MLASIPHFFVLAHTWSCKGLSPEAAAAAIVDGMNCTGQLSPVGRTMRAGSDNEQRIAADKCKHGPRIACAPQHSSKPKHLQKQKASLGTDLPCSLGTFLLADSWQANWQNRYVILTIFICKSKCSNQVCKLGHKMGLKSTDALTRQPRTSQCFPEEKKCCHYIS